MMTESDALETAQVDVNRILAKGNETGLPDTIHVETIKALVRRIYQFRNPRAYVAARRALEMPLMGATLSERTLGRIAQVINRARAFLEPEDVRALILWVNGVPPEVPGVAHHMVSALSESSGKRAIDVHEAQYLQILAFLRKEDAILLEIEPKKMTAAKRRVIEGLLLEADALCKERDGIGSRDMLIQARKLVRRWKSLS